MAGEAKRLAELVAPGAAGLAAGLPRQLLHGDICDDDVFFRGETRCSLPTSASWPNGHGSTTSP